MDCQNPLAIESQSTVNSTKKILSKTELKSNFSEIGVQHGDVILIRAALGSVGIMEYDTVSDIGMYVSMANTFLDALIEAVGESGTIVSLSFTSGTWIKKPKIEEAFTLNKKSYAGALPNAMIKRTNAYRSKHPTCSFVAIGKDARFLTSGHDSKSPAYEPVRKIIELEGKCMLVGCVNSSPGFTTTHLAESDLGYLNKYPIFARLNRTYYIDENGLHKLFRRKDPGLCSQSYYKFYSLYVKNGILNTGFVGNSYSILAPAKDAYDIDYYKLKEDKSFNICENDCCFTCNANRWDRIHKLPIYVIKKILRLFLNRS